jgi:hypothetical protein
MHQRHTSDSYARYSHCSDAELLAFLRQGPESFIPEAWNALKDEIEHRHLQLVSEAPLNPIHTTPPVGLGGWLAVFQIYIGLMLVASAVMTAVLKLGTVEVLFVSIFDATLLTGLLMMYARAPATRRFWIIVLILVAAITVAGQLVDDLSFVRAAWFAVWPGVWSAYWYRSSRVRATFRQAATPRVSGEL